MFATCTSFCERDGEEKRRRHKINPEFEGNFASFKMAYKGSRMTGTSRVFPCPDPDAPPVIPTKIFSSSTIVEKMMLNCSGCSTLPDIVHLDLSNRRISTLDPAVFSRMSSLVDLNLTNNRLTGFPLSLGLRHLKKLNCNTNLLKSVHTLEQFPSVEELHIENNELTVADQYIAVYMLPKLKVLNGKEVDLRETILNMEETLQEQVHILWAESCAPLLKDPMSKAEVQMLEQQFIELLKNQVQFGPDALTDFTHHMLTVLAEKCVRQMTAHLRKIAEPGTPISKVQIVVRNDAGGSASKAMSNGSAAALAKSMEKRQNQAQSSEEPAQKKAKAVQGGATPKGKVPKTSAKKKMIEAQKRQEAGVVDADNDTKPDVKEEEEVDDEDEEMESQDSNQECGIAYEPVHLLRCHSVDNDPTDCKTNVWKCAFEPNPEIEGASKWTVATCGSNQVCVIDCNSGKVLKKYQHTREKEEFYCIAWTKLSVINEQQRRPTTVLAAGGVRGSIKLLHTTQLLCYAEIKCEKKGKPVNCLLFHPKRPTWLFCGSEDITVIDIGIPQGADLKTRHKKLFTLEAPGRCLGLVVCPKSNFLMAGCDNGCYGWDIDVKGPMSKREKSHNVEFLLPSKARLMGDEEEEMEEDNEKEGDMIDGLALLKNDLIASKVACDGAIHVWSLSKSRKRQVPGSKEVTINPHYTLEWCDSDSVYLDIGTWPGCGVLVSGDDQGEVWVYDVSKKLNTKIKKPVKPSQLLPWPENNEQEMEEEEEPKVKEISDQEAEAILKQREAEEAAAKQPEEECKTEEKAQEQSSDATVEKQETAESAVAHVLEEVVTQVVGNDEKEEAVVVQEPADQQKEEKPVDGQEMDAETAKEAVETAPKDANEGEVAEEKAKEEEVADSSKAAESEQEKTEEADKAEATENNQDAKVEEVEEKLGNEAAEPQKRGRGRPKKYVSSKAPKEKPPSTPSGTPRGRGRPRKTSIPNDGKDSENQKDQTPRAAAPGSAAQTARARREAKIQEAAKKAKLAQIKAEKKLEEKARKKAEAEQAKAEKAKLKAENAKARAEIAELRQSLKKSKGAEELILADSEERIIVNDVAISSDCKFIVSVTNKNLICVWQRV